MMLPGCPREKEVRELVARGHWPQACTPEQSVHLTACRSCGELVLVAEAFQRARSQAVGAATLVSPGVLWWRAQLRRRNEALRCIGKPILGAQIFALALSLLLAAVFVVSPARMPDLAVLWPSALFGSAWSWMVLIPVFATLVLLGGVVVYLASEKQR